MSKINDRVSNREGKLEEYSTLPTKNSNQFVTCLHTLDRYHPHSASIMVRKLLCGEYVCIVTTRDAMSKTDYFVLLLYLFR